MAVRNKDKQREDEVQVGAAVDAAPSDASQQDLDNAPDSGDAPHFSPSRSALGAGADKPHAVPATVVDFPTIIGTDVPVADDPALEGTVADAEANVKRLERAPDPEDEDRLPDLPDNAFNSEAYKAANSQARDAFGQCVRRPGHIFRDHGGRYVNIFDLEDVYDVEPGTIVPDGLFLFPTNYLLREDERAARVRS